MREILFRGKTIPMIKESDGIWVEGSLILVNKYCCILEKELDEFSKPYLDAEFGTIDGVATPVRPETIGQYTGLNDINGTKIFEGDIVKLFLIDGVEIGVIKYSEDALRFLFYENSNKDRGYSFDNTCYFEVLGNIHDNPELLQKED